MIISGICVLLEDMSMSMVIARLAIQMYLQTQITSNFLYNISSSVFMVSQWFAVEEDDGLIDRIVTIASYEDITKFGSLFADLSRKKMTDGHLWISVFSRPDRSYFTRVQRASVILALLFLTMVVNAMFYGRDEGVIVQNIKFGPFQFNTFQLWVSFVGSLIVIPPSMIIDHLFRKSKPKPSKVGVAKVSSEAGGK